MLMPLKSVTAPIWHFVVKFSLLLLLMFAGFAGAAAPERSPTNAGIAQQATDIEVFVREGCPHCAKAEAFLQALQREQPDLRIRISDIYRDRAALERLRQLTESEHAGMVRVPAFYLHGRLIVGYSDEATTGKLLRLELAQARSDSLSEKAQPGADASSCEAVEPLSCTAESATAKSAEDFDLTLLGRRISLQQVGLPLFTVAMGLLDGFNPCSMWVLVLMISLLAPMQDRLRMLAVAGAFIAVEGIAYFIFMAAWLNLFLLIGLSRTSEIIIAGIAILAGAINLKDFWRYGWGVSLSIPQSAKPGIYARIRGILQAKNLLGAMIGAVVLAILVQIVEFMCTSGFPALYTRILTLRQTTGPSYYGYLLLYNIAYMLDDLIVLGIGVVTLSQRRLQENEGRWLKLVSGLVMVGLGLYLLIEV